MKFDCETTESGKTNDFDTWGSQIASFIIKRWKSVFFDTWGRKIDSFPRTYRIGSSILPYGPSAQQVIWLQASLGLLTCVWLNSSPQKRRQGYGLTRTQLYDKHWQLRDSQPQPAATWKEKMADKICTQPSLLNRHIIIWESCTQPPHTAPDFQFAPFLLGEDCLWFIRQSVCIHSFMYPF